MKSAHISPREAVDASNILRPKHLIPMHYGTYDLSDEPLGEPIRKLKELELQNNLQYQIKYLKIVI